MITMTRALVKKFDLVDDKCRKKRENYVTECIWAFFRPFEQLQHGDSRIGDSPPLRFSRKEYLHIWSYHELVREVAGDLNSLIDCREAWTSMQI